MKKPIALLMAAAMVVSLAGCGSDDGESSQSSTPSSDNADDSTQESSDEGSDTGSDESSDESSDEGSQTGGLDANSTGYVYKDSVSVLCSNWNPHTYQTADDGYLAEFIRSGFYDFVYNDELHPVEGMDPFEGYTIIPMMAASDPVDVTEAVKADHPEFNIPESAKEGFAYTIDLNPNAVWEDGTPINADSYVYSMQQLLDPVAKNYRAVDYYTGNFVIAGAELYANQGLTTEITLSTAMSKAGISTLEEYLEINGDQPAYINWNYSFGAAYDFDNNPFDGETVNAEALSLEAEDEVVETPLTLKEMWTFYPLCYGSDEQSIEQGQSYFADEIYVQHSYPSDVDYSTVGLYKSGDYQITIVFAQALSGFNLQYALTSNWLVKEDLYESNKKINGDAYSSTYNTSVETTSSYGPYKLVEFQSDKALRLVKNENWVGYSDGQHKYKDPTDGEVYDMYQTTEIQCQVVAEASTRKLMFLKGELMGYGLQQEDFATYRNSEYAYATPKTSTYFFIFNGYMDAIKNREASEGFDQTKYDLETLTLKSFRQAVAVTYDKELFAATISPARKGGYGLIGSAYVYDPDTGAKYRDTDYAKQILCDFYSVDASEYSSLDEAVASITGYDPEAAKALYTQAFNEALEAGFITDTDGDGICDQTIDIEYAMSVEADDFMTKTINYLNEKMTEVTAGTPFEGKIVFTMSAPYGNEWSNKIKAGLSDTVLGGWSGSLLNPFSIIDLYTNGLQQYDANWFDATTVNLTHEVNGESITMNLRQWSQAVNGTTVTVGGKDYNFGESTTDIDERLSILAALEGSILQTYDYIPIMEDASMALLSQQVFYVVDEYSPVMARGGIAYMKYNYNESEWAAYVAEQGGELKY